MQIKYSTETVEHVNYSKTAHINAYIKNPTAMKPWDSCMYKLISYQILKNSIALLISSLMSRISDVEVWVSAQELVTVWQDAATS